MLWPWWLCLFCPLVTSTAVGGQPALPDPVRRNRARRLAHALEAGGGRRDRRVFVANRFFTQSPHFDTFLFAKVVGYALSAGLIIFTGEEMHRARERGDCEAAERRAIMWESREQLRITLASIGDGVMVVDAESKVMSLNAEAEGLTGWREAEAIGRPLTEVFRIVNEDTGEPAENPVKKVLR